MLKNIISASTMSVVVAVVILILVEWLVGCGEPIYSADGAWRTDECLFLSAAPATGRW
jgi:hypothetical protein